MRALALTVLLSGCAFVARDTKKIRVVSEVLEEVPVRTGAPILETQVRDATIRVFAHTPRTCRRDRVEQLEVTHGKRLGFEFLDAAFFGDAYGIFFAVVFAPFTLSVSGLIAGIELAIHRDTTTTDRRVTENGFQPCPAIGRRAVVFTPPSGHRTTVITRADGTATFELPGSEPDLGTVVLSTTDGKDVGVAYYRNLGVCEAQRIAQLQVATTATTGRRELLERIPRCGAVTGTDPKVERAWELALAAAVSASRGDCRVAFDAEAGVKNLDPQLHATIYGLPEVTGCLQRETARRRHMTDCMLARADAMRAAQTIQDPQKRGEALRKIPQCKP